MNFVDLIVNLVEEFFSLLGEVFRTITSSGRPSGYADDFARKGQFISRWSHGFTVNGSKRGRLTRELSRRHMAIISASGGGKSTRIILNNILLAAREGVSMIVHDVSGELAQRSARYLSTMGYSIQMLDFTNPQRSDGYNPVQHATTSSELSQVADLIVRANLSGQSDQSFWNESAKSLIHMCLVILKSQEVQFRNLSNLRYLLNQIGTPAGQKMLDQMAVAINDEVLFSEYKNFLAYDSKLRMNIISTSKSALHVLNDDNVALITGWNSIDLEFRKRPTALYLKIPSLSANRLSPISSLLIEQCFNRLMVEIPTEKDLGVYIILDELASMILPNLEMVLSTARKYDISLLYALQHPDQLKMKYGAYQARSMLQNTHTKIYTYQSHEIARELSDSLGYRDVEDSDTGRKRTMPLMPAREIATLPPDRALVFVGNHAFRSRLYPYYKNRKMQWYARLPVWQVESKPPFDKPPLISLDKEEPKNTKS